MTERRRQQGRVFVQYLIHEFKKLFIVFGMYTMGQFMGECPRHVFVVIESLVIGVVPQSNVYPRRPSLLLRLVTSTGCKIRHIVP